MITESIETLRTELAMLREGIASADADTQAAVLPNIRDLELGIKLLESLDQGTQYLCTDPTAARACQVVGVSRQPTAYGERSILIELRLSSKPIVVGTAPEAPAPAAAPAPDPDDF